MSASDQVRQYVIEQFVRPAKKKGIKRFSVRAGDVHTALKFRNRVPVVCQALESEKLLRKEGLRLVEKMGPPSGRSTSVVYTYELGGEQRASEKGSSLMDFCGIAKGWFAPGEWESSIREERKAFSDAMERREEDFRQ